MSESVRKNHVLGWVMLAIMIAAVVTVALNWRWCVDFVRGIGYTPSSEMSGIMGKLALTDRGQFLFKASRPELLQRDEFNSHCVEEASETAVLGCYAQDTVYVYNITDKELVGIQELTTAHELLHAVYARMSADERGRLSVELEKVLAKNPEGLKDELENYDKTQRDEELYVRAGTEVADLPEALERHYAEVFTDQDKVVGYYNNYISVFRALEAELEALEAEMNELSVAIDNLTAEYEARVRQLNGEIEEFNNCAMTAGCFSSQGEFRLRRAALVDEQASVEAIYNQISGMIDTYNSKVEQYNADAKRGRNLNRKINSTAEPEEIE